MSSRLRTCHGAGRPRPHLWAVAGVALVLTVTGLSPAAPGLASSALAAPLVAAPLPASPVLAAATAAQRGPGWYVATQPAKVFSGAPAVACVSGGSDCVAIGAGTTCAKMVGIICVAQRSFNVAEYSRDGGRSWAVAPVPPAADGQFIDQASVSCARAGRARTDCAAWAMLVPGVGASPSEQAAYFSSNGGANWSVASPPAPVGPTAWQAPVVSCYEVQLGVVCAGAPDSVGTMYSTNGGASWTSSSSSPSVSFGSLAAQDLSCAIGRGQMDCAAVGYTVDTVTGRPVDTAWYSTDGGDKWAPGSLHQREGELNTVSCVAARGQVWCAALGTETTDGVTANVSVYSQDGGKTWSTSVFPAHISLPSPWGNVSCAAIGPRAECAAWGSTLLFSADGGATWVKATGPNRAGGDIECLPSAPGPSCYVVGARAAYSNSGGATWLASKTARGFDVENSMLRDNIACAYAGACVVAGTTELFTSSPAAAG